MNNRMLKGSSIAIPILLVLAVLAQSFDFANDRAISNVVTMICGGVIYLLLLINLYRWLAKSINRPAAALVIVGIVAVPWIGIRLRGFSGEMMPIIERRFTADQQLQSVTKTDDKRGRDEALTDFPQFLGPDRTAVLATREFEIPQAEQAEQVWRIEVGAGWSGVPIVDHYCVTMEQRGDNEAVTCYDLADGKLIWLHEVPARHFNLLGGEGPRATPTIADGKVYAQGATGIVRCLDLKTGELIWQQELLQLGGWTKPESEGAITWGRSGSPLIVDGLCVLPFGHPGNQPRDPLVQHRSLIALDAASGEVRWTAGDDQISYASPVLMTLAGVEQIVSVNESTVTGHQITDGQVLWTIDWPGSSNGTGNCSCALPVGEDKLLIAKGYSIGCGLYSLEQSEGQWLVDELWTDHRLLKTKFTHACIDGSIAYGLSDGTFECVDLNEPARLWTQPRGTRYGHGQAIRVEDCLVVQADTGEVKFVACDPLEFRELATIPALSSKTWNVPTIAGRYLLARNDIEAVLYRLPARTDSPPGIDQEATSVSAADDSSAVVDSEQPEVETPDDEKAASEDPGQP